MLCGKAAQASAAQASAREALQTREAELEQLKVRVRESEDDKVLRIAASGVLVQKHGRMGKPHPRHVRVLPSLRRLEWSKAGAGGGDSMVKVPSWRGRGTPRRPPQLTVPASRLLSTLRRSQGANKLAP